MFSASPLATSGHPDNFVMIPSRFLLPPTRNSPCSAGTFYALVTGQMRCPATKIATVLTLLSLVGSGCSVAFVRPAPADHEERPYFSCTNSYLAPGLDATVGGLALIGMVGDANDRGWNEDTEVGALYVAAFLVSAGYGLLTVSECQDAEGALAARYARAEQLQPAPLPRTGVPTVADQTQHDTPLPPPAGWPPAYPGDAARTPLPPPPQPPAPPPAPPPPPASPDNPRTVFAPMVGLHTLFNTPSDTTRLMPYFALRVGVDSGAVEVDLFGEYGSDSGYASRSVGIVGLMPLAKSRPRHGLDYLAGFALKYVDLSWAGPRVSGVAVQPTLALRLETGWRMRLRVDFAYEIQTFKQESVQLLIPQSVSGGFAHGPRLSLGVEF
jgi:hypothetical protein